MDSYFLSETCKYLYLLFDEDNQFLRMPDIIFSTEAHMLPVFSSSPSWSFLHNRASKTSTAKASHKHKRHGKEQAIMIPEIPITYVANTCAAINGSRQGRLKNATAELESMFREYLIERKKGKLLTSSPIDTKESDTAPKLLSAPSSQDILQYIQSIFGAESLSVPQPTLKIGNSLKVNLWGTYFNVYIAEGYLLVFF